MFGVFYRDDKTSVNPHIPLTFFLSPFSLQQRFDFHDCRFVLTLVRIVPYIYNMCTHTVLGVLNQTYDSE